MNTNFNKYFPILPYEIDKDIRKSYKGGFTYLNKCYKEKETGTWKTYADLCHEFCF